jgi:two-component system sensor histidine kinase PilS (NtrC family)
VQNVTGSFPHTRTVILARQLLAVVVVLSALVGGGSVALLPIVWLGVIATVLTVVYLVWAKLGGLAGLLLPFQLVADILLITLVAHFSGGPTSPYRLLYFLPVIAAAATLGSRAGAAITGLAAVGYLALGFTGSAGWSYFGESGAIAEIVILVVSLLLVAILVGFLSVKASDSLEKLEAARSKLGIAELRASRIVDSIGSGLALIDSDGRLVYLNGAGASILGVTVADPCGRDYRLIFAEVPAFCERIASALEAGRPEARAEFFVRKPSGGSLPVGLSTSILTDAAGAERGVIAIFQDLTEARRMEERIRHTDQLAALGEFAAGVAHEIRNPLNAIRGSVDLLKDTLGPSDDNEKLMTLITREVDRLSNLVNDVLRYGRLESGERQRVRLDSLVPEIVAIAQNHPSCGKKVAIETDTPEPVAAVVNAEQVKQLLLNLMINAIEAIDGDGTVRIALVSPSSLSARGLEGGSGDELAIIVEDTGCGMVGDKLDEIFQPFKTSKKHGTGLGLAIVDKIVRSHGGRVTVTSELGKGSRFVVHLPA